MTMPFGMVVWGPQKNGRAKMTLIILIPRLGKYPRGVSRDEWEPFAFKFFHFFYFFGKVFSIIIIDMRLTTRTERLGIISSR